MDEVALSVAKIMGTGSLRLTSPEPQSRAVGTDPALSLPRPPTLSSDRAQVLDKLGARLEFARTCAALYRGLVDKLEAHGAFRGGPTRAALEHFRDEVLGHADLAQRLIARLGGDPTAPTGAANRQAGVTTGLRELLEDPRTSLIECLDAVILAELVDRECWEQLADLASPLRDPQTEAQLRRMARTAGEHLIAARLWLSAAESHGAPRQN